MTRTVILVFHPDLSQSRANVALMKAAAALPDVELIDMAAAFPDGLEMERDGASGAALLLSADRIVLQFPLQWYSTPPLLRAWQNAVLTRMFYVHFSEEGRRMAGIPLMIAATAGNVPEAYGPQRSNGFAMIDLFAPLQAMAHRCGLIWAEPFVLYRAAALSDDELMAAGTEYAATLAGWIATPNRKAA